MTPLLVFGSAAALAASSAVHFEPGTWYHDLVKPHWAPADWVFPLVGSGLYPVIAVAGWRVWQRTRRISLSLVLWFAQLALSTAWFWLFFGLHLPLLAFAGIVLLLVLIVLYGAATLRLDHVAVLLFIPYGFCAVFAAVLNQAVWKLNLGLL